MHCSGVSEVDGAGLSGELESIIWARRKAFEMLMDDDETDMLLEIRRETGQKRVNLERALKPSATLMGSKHERDDDHDDDMRLERDEAYTTSTTV